MAQSTASRERGVAVASSPRAMVRDMTGTATRFTVEFDVRTVYDFLISLAVGGDDLTELPPEEVRWLREARASLPADVRAGMLVGDRARSGLASEITALALAHPAARDAADLVALVEATPALKIARMLLCLHQAPEVCQLMDQAFAGDAGAAERIEGVLEIDDRFRPAARSILHDPVGAAERLHLALRAWLGPFREREAQVGHALERDVAARDADRRTLDPADLVERTTGGIRILPDPRTRRVVLAPSYFSRPFNYVFASDDWRLYCYPIADAALGDKSPFDPPDPAVRLYRALGDPSRLRILKLLSDRDMYLTEIAQQLSLSKPTIKHHLAQLRAAGLVTATDAGMLTYYSLRRQRLDEASAELHGYLG